ncbi:MAG TPA: glycosyl hydrolase, partial [Naasia sp.]
SPLVSYRAATAQEVTIDAAIDPAGDGRGTVTVGGDTWGVVTTSGTLDGRTAALDAGGSLVLFPVPDGADADALMGSAAPLASVTTAYAATEDGQETTLTYVTESGDPTLVVPLPHQTGAADCGDPAFSTIYGDVPLCDTGELRFTTAAGTAAPALDLSGISDEEHAELSAQLKEDVAATETFAADTYFGGKSLYRAAMLLQLARQLDDQESAESLTADLTEALDRWTEPGGCDARGQECFVFDPALGTVVGLAPSFGSEEGNDHHFHYGYFLYAAAIVAQEDPSLTERWAPVLDVLAADIATAPGTDTGFPALRAFDPYFSHSWASGYSPFADGNNQESSSEAVTAWAGLSLWASASGDAELGNLAAWLLSAETASALAYWVNPDLSGDQFSAFGHDLVSINWGGKRDFATWFSPEPSAVIGIQLVPMAPSSNYLGSEAAGGPEQIGRLLDAAAPDGYDVMFGDFLLMYRSLAGGDEARAALEEARTLPDERIDDGDSRAYLLAYILSNTSRG